MDHRSAPIINLNIILVDTWVTGELMIYSFRWGSARVIMKVRTRKEMQVRKKGLRMQTRGRSQNLNQSSSLIQMVQKWAYEPSLHMTNLDLSVEGNLKFSRLPHRTLNHASTVRDVRVLEVGMEYPNNDIFLATLKRYNIKNCVNYYVMKSRTEKFEGKCVTKDKRCK
ncbi:hypothetical protein J1N35_040915 [Gossypium stocksii]|uniref:Uncharacterized protein n=1 Tax=Gossypium stocksii TaxID=47602 RepID=A0A9D3UEV9_9ROSI|nr:hypothetical protein J1N35_040915 [Gossypium stocksii]